MKRKTYTATHRCEKMLKEKCSIRYGLKHDFVNGDYGWYLRHRIYDSEYDVTYLGNPVEIEFCPFCGEKLS